MGTYKTPGGHLVFASHGDAEPSVGNVGKALNVSSVTNNLLKMHAGDPFGQKVDVALFGHWHTPSVFMLQDGTVCIVNGGLLGSDPYAQNGVGFFNSMPAQVLFESVPGHPVGDHRIIQLRDADQDSSYDAIISLPTKGGLDFSF
jgi:predicted phosphodiesterase